MALRHVPESRDAEAPDRLDHHRAFVDGAAAAGVGHVVYVSFFGAAPDATFTLARDHWATEQYIRGTGMAFTFLPSGGPPPIVLTRSRREKPRGSS